MRPPPWVFTAIFWLVFYGPPLLGAKFFYDSANTQIDSCVEANVKNENFDLDGRNSTTINVQWSTGKLLFIRRVHPFPNTNATITLNGECTLVFEWVEDEPGSFWATINGEKCGHWIFVRDGKVVADYGDERTPTFCQGKSVQNDVGDGLHSWMSIEYRGTGDDGSRCVIAMYDKDGDLGEYHLPTTTSTTSTSTSTSSSTTTTTELLSSTSMLAVTTPNPHVVVTGAFECWGQPDSWGTVVVLNRRTDASGRRVLEFCGSQEMLPNGTLRMEAGGAAKPEEVFYFIQHVCESLDTTDYFACFSGNLGQSEWAAKAIDLGLMELGTAGK
ncbi:hypothetical protein M3Y99_00687200 [Aphelenchoides fujianensis]|nr:hypothetical protein M3Y99_00687200 [Aphelenchoides fujianensis]